jgi:tRNA modification GTPase
VATPAGVGGIAVVRLSGPDALPLAQAHLSAPSLPERQAVYCRFDDLDDGIAIYYPSGYTGEPTVEFSCHGSLYVQQALVQALTDSGARLAEPGEFTMRAFLNGRLNLSQAEAVADLIDAVTPIQHRLAVSQLRGGYADELRALRQQLLDLTSLLELELDFSQEDVEFADRSQLTQLVDTIGRRVDTLRNSFSWGNALKRGVPLAIIGRPNAGKSSLLNALLHDDRAIVSPVPGTTRDTIEEAFVIDGIPFRIIDTAGLRQSDDPVETMGIQRTLDAVKRADYILYVHDATQSAHAITDDLEQLKRLTPLDKKHLLVVFNKVDLLPDAPPSALRSYPVSAKNGTGLDQLAQALAQAVKADRAAAPEVLLTNARHLDALAHVGQALAQVSLGLSDGIPSDLVAVDLRDALHHLGTITGEVTDDEVLGNIFSRFCVGK